METRPSNRRKAHAAGLSMGFGAWLLTGLPLAQAQPVVHYTYDAVGRLVEVRAPGEILRLQYDAAGNLTAEIVEAPPHISATSPGSAAVGGGPVTLTIDGLNFGAGSVVRWNGTALATTVAGPTRLVATIPASVLLAPAVATVTVASAGAPAVVSNGVPFFVNAPGPAVAGGPSAQVSLSTGAGTVTVSLAGVSGTGALDGGSVAPPDAPPGLAWLPSGSLDLSASGFAFASAAICVPYSDAEVSALGLDEQLLVLLHRDAGGAWTDITTSRDPAGNFVCGTTASFSPFAIAGVVAGAGTNVRYLAEGSTGAFFDAQIALANPDALAAADVTLRFLKGDGTFSARYVHLPPLSRRTVLVDAVAAMADTAFATVVESDRAVVVDRTMTWSEGGYGSHAETSVLAPSPVWYLAEGATHSGFELFYLIQNPNGAPADVEVTYLRPAPAPPLVKSYTVAANSRFNIWVDLETFPAGSGNAALSSTDVSAVVRSRDEARPIIVERAMYLDARGQMFGAGHDAAGVTAPATEWLLAEGATGPYFDLFILIANPGSVDADVEATYLLPDGTTIVKGYQVAANSRFNIWVDLEGGRLADTAVSTTVRSTNGVPVIVERAMWWPGPTAAAWEEAHASAGAVASGEAWALAEGEHGGPRATETYVLVANTSAAPARVRVTLLFDGGDAAVAKEFDLAPTSRFNVYPPADFPAQFPAGAWRRFGVLVESLGDSPARIVVERAMYSNASGRQWAAGTNATATRIR